MARKKRINDEAVNASGGIGDFGSAISALCDEKGISKEKVIETIEAALAAAYKKDYGKKGQNIRAEFDEVSGNAKFYLIKEVVDETTREFIKEEDNDKPLDAKTATGEEEKLPHYNIERDLTSEEAKKIKKGAKIGDIIETVLPEEKDYGRVAAQTAKQVIIQRIREAERDSMFEEYKNKEGEVISGVVQRVEGRNVFIDLGKSVGALFPGEQIEKENYRVGQRVKVYLVSVDVGTKGPGITLSRVHPEMVKRLFELQFPFIALLFGSHTKGKANKHSDIDLLTIGGDEKEIRSIISLWPEKIHLTAITYKDFIHMAKSREFTAVSEAVKNNIILVGIEEYYRLLSNAQ